MFFTHASRLIAILAFVLGVVRIMFALGIAAEIAGPYEAALARYTATSSSGEAIEQGLLVIMFAVALGTLAEISYAQRKGRDQV